MNRNTPMKRSGFRTWEDMDEAERAERLGKLRGKRNQLKAKTKVVRATKVKARNPERLARLWKMQFGSAEFVAFTRMQPSAVSGERGPCECCHVKSRGAGGRWTDIIPMTPAEHRMQHQQGMSFFTSRGFDPQRLAAEHQARWLAFQEVYG